MTFKLIDKEKKGFARYCPTFAKAYDVLTDRFRIRKKQEENAPEIQLNPEKLRRVRKLVSACKDEYVLAFLREDTENMFYLASLIKDGKNKFGNEYSITDYSTKLLGMGAHAGLDISPAIPYLENNISICCQELAHHSSETLEAALENLQTRERVVSIFAGFLSSDIHYIPYFGSEGLRHAAILGADISGYLPALRANFGKKKLSDVSAGAAIGAVVQHHINRDEWKNVLQLLDLDVNGGAHRAVGAALIDEKSRKKITDYLDICEKENLDIISAALLKQITSQDITTYPGLLVAILSLEDDSRTKKTILSECMMALSRRDGRMLKAMLDAFMEAAKKTSQETRTFGLREIIRFVQADWFQEEMRKNSRSFEMITKGVAWLLDEMREAERKTEMRAA